MFPCCSRVYCPCCSPYSRVSNSDEVDGLEMETLSTNGETTEVDGVSVTISDSDGEEDITSNAVEIDAAGYQGLFSSQESAGLASAGYAILRICDYCQLCLLGQQRRDQEALARVRRDVNATAIPIYDARNSSSNHTAPQWIYPCGITPDAIFPQGVLFSRLNTTSGRYETVTHMNYSDYFTGGFDTLAHRYDLGRPLLTTEHRRRDLYRAFPYGIRGTGDFIFLHFGNFTPQYPYASYGISDNSFYNGTSRDCPRWIFNATQFFGGGYLGLEEPGFDPIYPCGIHPNGLFTGQWLGFPNGTIPPNSYPFGYFPNGTFPYLDYFFNPDFNHTALYWAVQRNETNALQNFTSFLNPNNTRSMYHHIPTEYTEPFASCYDIDLRPSRLNISSHGSSGRISVYNDYGGDFSSPIDPNFIRASLWAAQLGAEVSLLVAHSCSSNPRHNRILQALYLGTRAANIIHSAVDLGSNLAHVWENGPTEGQGEQALRNMLTLTDVLSFTNDAIYFCTPAIQRIQERVSQGLGSRCFRGMCSSLANVNRVVRNSLGRLTAIAGAVGVACTAGLGAALTADLINNGDQDNSEQRVILGAQIAVAAAATWALGWIARSNAARANSATE